MQFSGFVSNGLSNGFDRQGRIGSQLYAYLHQHPTSFASYERGIATWHAIGGPVFEEWYLPAMVEQLSDWTYDEKMLHARFMASSHPSHWFPLFLHAFEKMPRLSLEAALRWEMSIAQTTPFIKSTFYGCLEKTALLDLVRMGLAGSLHERSWERLSLGLFHGGVDVDWEMIWVFLTEQLWSHTEHKHAMQVALFWAQYAPLLSLEHYLQKATALLKHDMIQWAPSLLNLVICRVRQEEEGGGTLLRVWRHADTQERSDASNVPVPWRSILSKWTDWDIPTLQTVVEGDSPRQLALQHLILGHPHYRMTIKQSIVRYRCEHDLVPVEMLNIVADLPNTHWILYLWLLFRGTKLGLSKEWIRAFQHAFGRHPLYEKDALGDLVPGWHGLCRVVATMDITYEQALGYIEDHMLEKEEWCLSVGGEQLAALLASDGS